MLGGQRGAPPHTYSSLSLRVWSNFRTTDVEKREDESFISVQNQRILLPWFRQLGFWEQAKTGSKREHLRMLNSSFSRNLATPSRAADWSSAVKPPRPRSVHFLEKIDRNKRSCSPKTFKAAAACSASVAMVIPTEEPPP